MGILTEMLAEAFGPTRKEVFANLIKCIGSENCEMVNDELIVYSESLGDKAVKYLNSIYDKPSTEIHKIYVRFISNEVYTSGIKKPYHGEIQITSLNTGKPDHHVDANWNLYHVTSKKNLDSILKNGLIPQQSSFNNGGKGNQPLPKSAATATDLLWQTFNYKALFACYKWQDCKKIAKDLKIQNPVMITFKPGKAVFYEDTLYKWAAEFNTIRGISSVYTLDSIPPENIVKTKEL